MTPVTKNMVVDKEVQVPGSTSGGGGWIVTHDGCSLSLASLLVVVSCEPSLCTAVASERASWRRRGAGIIR